MKKQRILTGDRPSGKLHLGHYFGSLQNRVELQNSFEQFVMIADLQALTDNFDQPDKVRENVFEVCLDYLAVGIDPEKTTIFIQSQIPAIYQLTKLYLNLVSVNRLQRNPTVKEEIKNKGLEESLNAGFLVYPISQAADLTCVKAEVVPVGNDQLPMIEQCNEIVDSFNNLYGNVLTRCKPLLSSVSRLPGVDGKKMSKSMGNAIYLSDSDEDITKKVMLMYTDPNHLKISDPGKVEDNVVFTYLDIFHPDKAEVEKLKNHYRAGGLGDVFLKKMLAPMIIELIRPIRQRREELTKNPDKIWEILKKGSERAILESEKVLDEVKQAVKIKYF